MVAAHLGKEGVLNLLLRAGADVNQANMVSLLLYAISDLQYGIGSYFGNRN
jgi:hypothetical protein